MLDNLLLEHLHYTHRSTKRETTEGGSDTPPEPNRSKRKVQLSGAQQKVLPSDGQQVIGLDALGL